MEDRYPRKKTRTMGHPCHASRRMQRTVHWPSIGSLRLPPRPATTGRIPPAIGIDSSQWAHCRAFIGIRPDWQPWTGELHCRRGYHDPPQHIVKAVQIGIEDGALVLVGHRRSVLMPALSTAP